MTASEFLAFYPQFEGVISSPVLDSYISQANVRFSNLDDMAEEARRLYVAHKLTLYAKTMPASSAVSLSTLASSGDGTKITSKKVENVSVTYSVAASGALSELEETIYGQQLLGLIRLISLPVYVP